MSGMFGALKKWFLDPLDEIKKKSKLAAISAVALVLVIALSINFVLIPMFFSQNTTPWQPKPGEYQPKTNVLKFGYGYFTASVTEQDVIAGQVPQYMLPLDPSSISNYNDFKNLGFSQEVINTLLQNGFAVTFYLMSEDSLKSFDKYYDMLPENFPRFVTADMILHLFHTYYASFLMYYEVQYFTPWLNQTLKVLLNNALQLYLTNKTNSEIVNEALLRLLAYLIVPIKLMDPNYQLPPEIPELAEQMANEEITRIEQHTSMESSSIFKVLEDYTQYKPRGYYTYNETLKRYFKSVMFLGRMYFPVNSKSNETFSDVSTAMAFTLTYFVLTTQVNINGETWYAIDVYEKMYYITAFLVGYSDDLTFEDYEKVIEDVYESEFSTQLLTDINKLHEAKDELTELDHSKITGTLAASQDETIGLRFMGQRFILDSYIFQNLIYNKVQDRFLPSALDIPAVFNFSRARYHLRNTIQTKIGYKENLETLTKEFDSMNVTQWTLTIYNGWLYTLKAALRENYTGFPTFMQTDAWKDEKLNTFCGSWTELRHDTILYAKQSYAKLTAAPPKSNKGFVEPLPLLWSRLKGLVLQLRSGLDSLDVLSEEHNSSLITFSEILDVLLNVSLKELNNIALTEEEENYLFHLGQKISGLLTSVENVHQKTTLVADVSTDPNSGLVLEEGTGYVHLIVVVIHDPEDNTLKIALGPVFSHYEFTQPASNRLADEEWAQMLSEGTTPDYPSWTNSFLVTSSG